MYVSNDSYWPQTCCLLLHSRSEQHVEGGTCLSVIPPASWRGQGRRLVTAGVVPGADRLKPTAFLAFPLTLW